MLFGMCTSPFDWMHRPAFELISLENCGRISPPENGSYEFNGKLGKIR